jgi:hypothetical protein
MDIPMMKINLLRNLGWSGQYYLISRKRFELLAESHRNFGKAKGIRALKEAACRNVAIEHLIAQLKDEK